MQDMCQRILEYWPVKMFFAGCASSVAFLLGDITSPPFVAIWLLVALDTLTRWMAIGRKESMEAGRSDSLLAGMGVAIILRRINSETFRVKFSNKATAYLILLIGFNQLDMVAPKSFFGHNVAGAPNAFITIWIIIGELKSIMENLIDAGVTIVKPLVGWAEKRQSQMTDSGQQYQYGNYPGTPQPNQQKLLDQIKSGDIKPPV